MNVLLTFDVEVWCKDWLKLDEQFSASFERYIYGKSRFGQYALPKTLEILNKHDLRGIFFVEPLFAARFGSEHLSSIVKLVLDAGQEVQLHLHPEWTDEAEEPLIDASKQKRQHLTQYSRSEQSALIKHGLRMLEDIVPTIPVAFRSGSFACNEDTFAAVADNNLTFECSINSEMTESRPGQVRDSSAGACEPFTSSGLTYLPMSVFRDGFGQTRHAQVGACSSQEMIEALAKAEQDDWFAFVILSHNFELMAPGKSSPDWTVVRRFERICQFLSENKETMPTVGFGELQSPPQPRGLKLPRVSRSATLIRYLEQGWRRFA